MKIITVIIIGIVGVVAISCANLNDKPKEVVGVTNQSILQWKSKSPQLFNNVGYGKLIESNIAIVNRNIKLQEDIGKVTNPFGIRDDVLDFIIKYFPDNESAIYAAISNEQYDLLIYRSKTDKEAINYANQGAISIWCLGRAIGINNVDKYSDELERVQNNTKNGKEMNKVITQKLGWKIFGFGHKTNQELDAICDKGNY